MTNKFKQTNKTLQKITTYDLDLKKTSSNNKEKQLETIDILIHENLNVTKT